MSARAALKQIIPPIVLEAFRPRKAHGWFGDYRSWEQAAKMCDGYQSKNILDKAAQAVRQVISGQKSSERDTVAFDQVEYSWPLLSGLLYAASRFDGQLRVLDFGGSLGSSFFQNFKFLSHLKGLRWSIVEQEHFVECGKRGFQTEQLTFHSTVEDCITQHNPNFILVSGVLQYLPEPYAVLENLLKHKLPFTFFDRTGFTMNGEERLTIQVTNPRIYQASYPCWFFAKSRFLSYFNEQHDLLAEFSCDFDGFNREYEQSGLKHLGFFFSRKDFDLLRQAL